MQSIDGAPVYSASDLVGFLACEYLTALERAALHGLVKRPHYADLLLCENLAEIATRRAEARAGHETSTLERGNDPGSRPVLKVGAPCRI